MSLRIAYLEALIITANKANRSSITEVFSIAVVQAGRDFRKYNEDYPTNLEYSLSERCYKASPTFKQKVLVGCAYDFLQHIKALKRYL